LYSTYSIFLDDTTQRFDLDNGVLQLTKLFFPQKRERGKKKGKREKDAKISHAPF
jgi:hypothetical protein